MCAKLFQYCSCCHLGEPVTRKCMLLLCKNSKHQKQNTDWTLIDVLTVYLILKSLSLESQQNVFSFKLLCCHHRDHYVSRTLDLRSLLLSEFCSAQTPFAWKHQFSSPPPPITRIHARSLRSAPAEDFQHIVESRLTPADDVQLADERSSQLDHGNRRHATTYHLRQAHRVASAGHAELSSSH